MSVFPFFLTFCCLLLRPNFEQGPARSSVFPSLYLLEPKSNPSPRKQAKYGVAFNSGGFEQLYAKLQAYAGERLGDDSLKQAAWQVLNTNTVGVWDPEQQVGGSDVLVGINEVSGLMVFVGERLWGEGGRSQDETS